MFANIDIVFLMIAAGLILMRLYKILGTRPDDESSKVVKIVAEKTAPTPAPTDDETIKCSVIPNFNKADFCARAKVAFAMILEAFANKDLETLKMLTGKNLFAKFKEIITERDAQGITTETDLIRISQMRIIDAGVSTKGIARVVVRFVSEQINLIKSKAGEVIEGDENFVQEITDVWTFERNLNNVSPVWFLVSTKKK